MFGVSRAAFNNAIILTKNAGREFDKSIYYKRFCRLSPTLYIKENVKMVMIKEKYAQLRLAHQFGGINTIGFTQTLWAILKKKEIN